MAAISDVDPMWWDRDIDDRGTPIRADVRQAAHQLWPEAVKRVRKMISDPAEAAELIEISVLHISQHLDRTNATAFAPNIPSLLSLHFSQELKRFAKKLGRIQLLSDEAGIEELAVADGWAHGITRRLDFQKIIGHLFPLTRTLVVMRLEQHSWKLIGAKLGKSPDLLRKAFWRDLRRVFSRMDKQRKHRRTRFEKLTSVKITIELPPQDSPPDAEPGEAAIINGFYQWVHQNHANLQRTGCPGRIVLAELVVAESKFGDEHTIKHIGKRAACVDDLTELRLEFERISKMQK